MRLISRIAGLFVLLPILIMLLRGDIFSRSPLVILGQLVSLALLVWARASFNQGQFRVVPAPAGGPLLIRGALSFSPASNVRGGVASPLVERFRALVPFQRSSCTGSYVCSRGSYH